MTEESPKIGAEELAIFRFVHERQSATVREVADHFAESGKARTTVLTVMERLRGKGLLSREKIAGAYRYSATLETSNLLHSLVGDFVSKVLGGSISPLAAYMSESEDISDDELKQLKRLVRDLDNKRKQS